MNDSTAAKTRKFLYIDENVKYTVSKDADNITIHCDHPIFVNRFKGNSATLTAEEFKNTAQKGSSDYEFFEKLKTSVQEYFLDQGL